MIGTDTIWCSLATLISLLAGKAPLDPFSQYLIPSYLLTLRPLLIKAFDTVRSYVI